ncbi:MAG: arylsulfatase [Planctomycetaceae bacterium]
MSLRASLLALTALAITRTVAAADVAPLNVVLVVADDLGWGDLGCYGQVRIPTPHIDRLAAAGMRFTQFYSGAPVCAPARCVLMTGRHTGHAEIRANQQARVLFPEFAEGQHPLSAAARTFPQVFREAGYATGAMGKWGLGPVGSTGDPNAKGFDLFFGYNCQAVAHSFYPATLWRNAERVPLNADPVSGHTKPVTGDVDAARYVGETYASRPIVAEAGRFIADHGGGPFLLYLPFTEPHLAMHPPPETVARFPREWDDGREPYRGHKGYLPHPRPRAGYAAMIAELDDHVGRILAALERAGVADRTLVLFTSDNGPTSAGGVDQDFFASTAGLRGGKGSVYEGGIRVPFIARLPGTIPAGAVCDVPGHFADLFPTLCAAAGLPAPAGLDGVNLWPLLTGAARTLDARRPFVWVFPEDGGQVAVRSGDVKVLRRGLATKRSGDWEVYDLARDPRETTDLAAERPEAIAAARTILDRETDANEVFPVAIPGVAGN